jgi:hypothetical protein
VVGEPGQLREGDGVLVPWGLDKLPGEITEVYENHAVVSVPTEGASGETLGTMPLRFDLNVLERLPPWRVVASKSGQPAAGSDAGRAWYVDAMRDGDLARVEVRVSRTLDATRGGLPTEVRRAFQTRGKSAVEKFASRYRLPRVVVVASHGIFELKS